MKKIISLIFLILICYLGFGQTTDNPYPIKQNIANSPNTEMVTNTWYGKGIVYAFPDTTTANLDPFIKHQAFAFIATNSPIALWYRDITNVKWVQLLPSGGTVGLQAWLTGGNVNVLGDGQGNATFGPLSQNGIKFQTNGITRFILDTAGILSQTAGTIGLGFDTSNGGRLTRFSGGSGGTIFSIGDGQAIGVDGTNNTKSVGAGSAIDVSSTSTKVTVTNLKPAKTTVVNGISDIAAFTDTFTTNLIVRDTLRGGQFTKYTGAFAADGSMIITDGNGTKWIREIDLTQPINVLWFGFVADGVTDNYTMWVTMMNYLIARQNLLIPGNPSYTYYAKLPAIYFPSQQDYYYFNHSITIQYNMEIYGDNNFQLYAGSKLKFPADSVGFRITYADEVTTGLGTSGVKFRNLYVYAETPGTWPTYDTTAHAFDIKRPVDFENIGVENFGGNAFNCDVTTGGNTDLSIFYKCLATGNLNGFYFVGADANAMKIDLCNAYTNRRWGFLDRSFLGNSYTTCHSANNGIAYGNKTFVLHRTGGIGSTYEYGALRDGFLTMPGDSTGWESDWQLIGDSTAYMWGANGDYNASTYYWTSGSYGIDFDHIGGENQYSLLSGCYSEGGQMAGYLGAKSLGVSGDQAAGWRNGAAHLEANNNSVTSLLTPIISGTESNNKFTAIRPRAIDVRYGTDGMRLYYDSVNLVAAFAEINSLQSRTKMFTGASVPATFSRSSLPVGTLLGLDGYAYGSLNDALKTKRTAFSNAAPVTGTWEIGDIVFSNIPTTSSAFGWRCTTAGTPGTWETLTMGGIDTTGAFVINVTSINDSTIRVFKGATQTDLIIRGNGAGGGGTPGGSNTEIQFNNSGAFGGSANFTWNGSRMSVIAATIGSTSTPDATSPLTIDAASTNTAYLLQMGKNGNPAYFRINKDGNITDIGGGAAPITSSGGKPYFPSGFSATLWPSSANGNSIFKSDWSGTLPWVVWNSGSTTDNQIGFLVTGTNATTKGDIQQWTDKDFNVLARVTSTGAVGVGATTPDASAKLDVQSTTQGFLPPRMTATQRSAISSPTAGLMVYDSDSSRYMLYNGAWKGLKFTDEGGGGTVPTFIYNEEFTGSTSSTYTLANSPTAGKLSVWKNGVKLPNSEFSLSGAVVTLTSARVSGDIFSNNYQY